MESAPNCSLTLTIDCHELKARSYVKQCNSDPSDLPACGLRLPEKAISVQISVLNTNHKAYVTLFNEAIETHKVL